MMLFIPSLKLQAAHKTDGFLIARQTDNQTRTFYNEQLPLDV